MNKLEPEPIIISADIWGSKTNLIQLAIAAGYVANAMVRVDAYVWQQTEDICRHRKLNHDQWIAVFDVIYESDGDSETIYNFVKEIGEQNERTPGN